MKRIACVAAVAVLTMSMFGCNRRYASYAFGAGYASQSRWHDDDYDDHKGRHHGSSRHHRHARHRGHGGHGHHKSCDW